MRPNAPPCTSTVDINPPLLVTTPTRIKYGGVVVRYPKSVAYTDLI